MNYKETIKATTKSIRVSIPAHKKIKMQSARTGKTIIEVVDMMLLETK